MRRIPEVLFVFLLLAPLASADGLILKDGRKVVGNVTDKKDFFEVSVEGQTLTFSKDDVATWVRIPKDVLGDAEKWVTEAKQLYQEGVSIQDEKTAEAKFREALPKVVKAREAYAEARNFFPSGESGLDAQLVNVMKLMRLVRERMTSQMATAAPVKPREVAPPPPPEPRVEPKVPEVKRPAIEEAFAVLADPERRDDEAQRSWARREFRKAWGAKGPGADLAAAGAILAARDDKEWLLRADVLQVKGPGIDGTYRGKLAVRSPAVSALVLADRRELRVRTAEDGTYVTPPGGSEVKAVEVKALPEQTSEVFKALQDFFKSTPPEALAALPEKEAAEAVAFLGTKVKELRPKAGEAAVEPLVLLAAGIGSSLVARSGGKTLPAVETAFKDLGYEKSEYGAMWGRREGLAMDDYHKWYASGEYGLAIVQFQSEYKSMTDPASRYALGVLMILRSLAEQRHYSKVAIYLEQLAQAAGSARMKEHLQALAKSIRSESPCPACWGTHQVNCTACKGKLKVDLECNTCGGSGKKVSGFGGGTIRCPGICQGKGRLNNVDCPKCKEGGQPTGKAVCKGRGCTKAVSAPSFESFAEAFGCTFCDGKGSLMRHAAVACPECAGMGLFLQPKSDPTKTLMPK